MTEDDKRMEFLYDESGLTELFHYFLCNICKVSHYTNRKIIPMWEIRSLEKTVDFWQGKASSHPENRQAGKYILTSIWTEQLYKIHCKCSNRFRAFVLSYIPPLQFCQDNRFGRWNVSETYSALLNEIALLVLSKDHSHVFSLLSW